MANHLDVSHYKFALVPPAHFLGLRLDPMPAPHSTSRLSQDLEQFPTAFDANMEKIRT